MMAAEISSGDTVLPLLLCSNGKYSSMFKMRQAYFFEDNLYQIDNDSITLASMSVTCASCGNKQYVHLRLVEVCNKCGAKNWTT